MRLKFVCLLLFLANVSPVKVQAQQKNWYKGNLHTHSYWSDGDEFPEMILEWYKKHDYQFLALSDHNIIAEGEKWKTIPKDSIHQAGFQQYLQKYGEDWVTYKQDSAGTHVLLTPWVDFRKLFEEPGKFMLFKAEEVTTYFNKKAVHMNAINIEDRIEPKKGKTIVELIQNNLDAIKAYGDSIGKPVLQHLNHPNFTYAIKADDIIKLNGEHFFEVFNGHPLVHNYGDSTHTSTEAMWDQINIAYINTGKPLLYGIATDDSHHYHQFGQKFSNAGRGWVTVKADTLTPSSIIKNMEAGNFYASTGVALDDIKIENDEIKISIKAEEGVHYKTQFIGVYKNSLKSQVLATQEGSSVKFEIPEGLLFLRAKIISDKPKKNPYQEGDVEVAWIQPFIPDSASE